MKRLTLYNFLYKLYFGCIYYEIDLKDYILYCANSLTVLYLKDHMPLVPLAI
jgi:hypothetical protein